MVRLRARVRCACQTEKVSADIPEWLEIEQSNTGYWLLHIFQCGMPFVHTWHSSVEDAKAEAKEEFNVSEDEWVIEPTEAREE